jgi:2-phosphosulfolactate phosphatase
MRLDVYPTVNAIPTAELSGRTAVVIDVLRATSTIVTALANGAAALIPVLTPAEAFERAEGRLDFLLGGERKSVRIEGFHLSNSPREYTAERVGGRMILFTTTNGTRAIRASAPARRVLIASLLNAPSVARLLAREGADAVICCAGTREEFSLEDTLCAGAIVELVTGGLPGAAGGPDRNDLAEAARLLYRQVRERLPEAMLLSAHGRDLDAIGLGADLRFCAQFGTVEAVPELRGDLVSF